MMKVFDTKGQTAFEYLLVVVIALSIVILVLMWVEATSIRINTVAGNQTDETICGLTECDRTGDVRCNIAACGGLAGWCDTTIGKCQVCGILPHTC